MFVLKLQQPHTRVKINGTGLAASFSESVPPTLWHYDLAHNPGLMLSVQEESGQWALKLRSVRGEQTVIAHFRQQEAAEAAYQALQSALTRRELVPQGIARAIGLTAAVMVTVAIFIIVFLSVLSGGKQSAAVNSSDIATAFKKPVELQHGVPQSADDILQLPNP